MSAYRVEPEDMEEDGCGKGGKRANAHLGFGQMLLCRPVLAVRAPRADGDQERDQYGILDKRIG